LLFQLVSASQGALIQGMRRIADLAKMGVWGALFGTLISIPVVYFLREKGVVPSLVGVALMTIITSWWYSRKINIPTSSMTASEVGKEAAALLKLGFAFMSSGLMTMGVAYAVRVIVLRKVGFEATGFYQSAWTLGGLYVGFILQAMAADFYPRLTASAQDNITCNRLVNEQTLVGLLLAGPGVIGTLTFAPLVIALFYSAKFSGAVGVLRWICLGTILQVITWPMSFIIVAKGRQAIFFGSELAWTVVSLGLAWTCVRSFGLNGAGIAFFGSYAFYGFMLYLVVDRLSNFRWSHANKQTGLFFLSLIAAVFYAFYLLPFLWAGCLGIVAALLSGAYSIRVLLGLISWGQIPRPLRRLLAGFGYAPADFTGVA
jgi:PST family polysaccharide transporter